MQQTDEPAPAAAAPRPGLIAGAKAFGAALKEVFGAQFGLLKAEWALARTALALMLVAGLVATVAAVGLALTALVLLGLALATWWGSWLWALLALCALQLIVLGTAIVMFRRCMHWLSLPLTRGQWTALVRVPASGDDAAQPGAPERPLGERP
jgi:hypothetical protein